MHDDGIRLDFRWNFSVNLIERIFSTLGMSIASVATVLPYLVSQLTDSKVLVGLVPAIFGIGVLLPQLLTASYTETLRWKKPYILGWALFGGRAPYLVIAIILLVFAERSPGITLILLFLLLILSASSNGFVIPAWLDMLAKVIPGTNRGLFFGLGNGIGALLGVAGGALTGYILISWEFPMNFSLLFTVAFVVLLISWIGVALTREPESKQIKPAMSLAHYFRKLPWLLKTDVNYSHYLVGQSVSIVGKMGGSFFIVYATERLGISAADIGVLTAVLIGSQALASVVWGVVGDYWGHRKVLAFGSLSMALSTLMMSFQSGPEYLWGPFVFWGVSLAADLVSNMSIMMEFSSPQDRPTYIGLSNTLLAISTFLAPIGAGLLVERVGYREMFGVAIVVAILGAMLIGFWVKNPIYAQHKRAFA